MPGICYGIQVGEDQQDCTESCISSLSACNGKLGKASNELTKEKR